jgi:hypothetical protein
VLCLELCHQHHSRQTLRGGSYLLQSPPVWNQEHFFYNIYYGAQATFQLGGNYWEVYRSHLHKVLLDNQQANGCWLGEDGFGPAYGTSMGVLALTVEYRFLPIYQRGDDESSSELKEKH